MFDHPELLKELPLGVIDGIHWMQPRSILLAAFSETVADDLVKAATSNPVDPEDQMVLTSTEIYSRDKELICRTWVVPPVHSGYLQRHHGPAISFEGSRSYQTVFSGFSTGHLRCMNFEGGKRIFPICPKCNISHFSPQHILQCLGFSCEVAVASPLMFVDCTYLWTHGSGLVLLDQMGISPTTTPIFLLYRAGSIICFCTHEVSLTIHFKSILVNTSRL
ncbi:uncharacterized protein TNCV_1542421 [Trichonephila clavipes]|nr:uncharacterized protein TNCV_1542421 [Trichonephila clavipes]